MDLLRKSILAFSVMAVAAGCAPKDETAPAGTTTPPTTTASAGPSLDEVATNAPAVLYFVKSNCGSNPMAIPLVNKIYEANKDSGKFYVVMNTDQSSAADWAKQNNATFPIIPDPDKKLINQYGIKGSQTGILVDKDLKETKRFAGFGKPELEALNASLGSAKVDLSDAPPSGLG